MLKKFEFIIFLKQNIKYQFIGKLFLYSFSNKFCSIYSASCIIFRLYFKVSAQSVRQYNSNFKLKAEK